VRHEFSRGVAETPFRLLPVESYNLRVTTDQTTSLTNATRDDLVALERTLSAEYADHRKAALQLDLTRGKPSPEQLALSDELDAVLGGRYVLEDGTDVRNYGGLVGIPQARRLGADLLGVTDDLVLAGGNASLTLMYQYLAHALFHGVLGPGTAWRDEGEPLRFLCVVPGYDRHFTITQDLGFEMLNVAMRSDGPDMDEVERLVSADPRIKGIWCVPKYQNPTGFTFSDDVVRRLAELGRVAGPHFRIMWDNAYAVHDLHETGDSLANLMTFCQQAGTADTAVMFASTSKITRAGSGISFMAASEANLTHFKKRLGVQMIGPDKVNQLRHVRLLKDLDGVRAHMRRHAEIIRPKFEAVLQHLDSGLEGAATWTRPRGGYFLSVDVRPGTAADVVRLSGEAGVKLTPAGATYPLGRDPNDANIRLAPTYPSLADLHLALPVFVTSVKLASVRQALRDA
jgi:DNA-binding transcriptional MocR family regulator